MFLRTSLNRGFTLLELLVVVTVIGILSSLLLPAVARGKQKAKHINELNAAKQLILAWQLYADEHEDAVLIGYISEDVDHTGLGSPIRDRYPWRLAPQLGSSFRAIYVNESRRFLDEAERMSRDHFVYRASLYPSLGYNSVFIGGDEQKFNPKLVALAGSYGTDWLVSRVSQIRQPSELIAFASARYREATRDEFGYYVVHPPYIKTRQWDAAFDAASSPSRFGYVHPRWSGRAVAAMTDGHAETLNQTELQDMRRWCNIANRPDWTLSTLP